MDQGLTGPRHLSGLGFLICQIRSLRATADGYWGGVCHMHSRLAHYGTLGHWPFIALQTYSSPLPPYSQPPGFPPPSLLLTQALPPTSFCWSESYPPTAKPTSNLHPTVTPNQSTASMPDSRLPLSQGPGFVPLSQGFHPVISF